MRICKSGKTIFIHLSEIKSNEDYEEVKINVLLSKAEEFK